MHPVGGKLGHKLTVSRQANALGVGKHQHFTKHGRVAVARNHGGHHLHVGVIFLLARVRCRGQFREAENIGHTMVTNVIARAKVLVGVVVKSAPADGTAATGIGVGGLKHPQVAKGVFQPSAFGVETLGGKHVPVVLGDQQRGASWKHLGRIRKRPVGAVVNKVIVSVDILKQSALVKVPHTSGLSCGVKLPGEGICALIEGLAVGRLVDAHPPKDNRGAIAVAHHHGAHGL